jgi:hypothetical protein
MKKGLMTSNKEKRMSNNGKEEVIHCAISSCAISKIYFFRYFRYVAVQFWYFVCQTVLAVGFVYA